MEILNKKWKNKDGDGNVSGRRLQRKQPDLAALRAPLPQLFYSVLVFFFPQAKSERSPSPGDIAGALAGLGALHGRLSPNDHHWEKVSGAGACREELLGGWGGLARCRGLVLW